MDRNRAHRTGESKDGYAGQRLIRKLERRRWSYHAQQRRRAAEGVKNQCTGTMQKAVVRIQEMASLRVGNAARLAPRQSFGGTR